MLNMQFHSKGNTAHYTINITLFVLQGEENVTDLKVVFLYPVFNECILLINM